MSVVAAVNWEVKQQGKRWSVPVDEDELFEAIEIGALDPADLVRGPSDKQLMPIGDHPVASEYLPPPRLIPDQNLEDVTSDLTPMIDVIFQLIIFFMIAATFTVQRTMDMPNSQKQEEQPEAVSLQELEDDHVYVQINADGSVHVQRQAVDRTEDLADALREAVQEKNSPELILDAADDALHEKVVAVIDAASTAEFETIVLVSRVDSNEP